MKLIFKYPQIITIPFHGEIKFQSNLEFDKAKRIEYGYVQNQIVKTLYGEIFLDGFIYFYKNGKIKSGTLTSPQTIKINNEKFMIYSDIFFYANGNIKEIFVLYGQEVKMFEKTEFCNHIYFYKNGKINEKLTK